MQIRYGIPARLSLTEAREMADILKAGGLSISRHGVGLVYVLENPENPVELINFLFTAGAIFSVEY